MDLSSRSYLLVFPEQTPLLPLGRVSDRTVTVYDQIRPTLRTIHKHTRESELYTLHDAFIHLH